ncbi:capsular biosynthesis protein [Sinorhizobium meliloti]|nr:capsular biosynthesis protein [Sinorhizobium meliloti]
MLRNEQLITAIIPVRLSKDKLYDEPERINRIIGQLPAPYVPLIVDYGTCAERAEELRNVAQSTNTKIVRVETGDVPFSVGHARDIGTQHATTPLVMYHDIDFLLSSDGYMRVVSEARLRGMPENAFAFFALPGAYLTQDFTRTYLDLVASGDGAFADLLVHDGVIRRDTKVFEHMTFAISAIVASRYHLLALGGHDKSFSGHGAEDFELMHRLSSYYRKGPRSRDYYKNTKDNSIQTYEGFRAFFALYGLDVFTRGIVISHLSHPRRADPGYIGTDNQARVSQVMRDYDNGVLSLPPLADETSSENTLVLVTPGSAPARALRHAFPAFGKHHVIPESSFGTAEDLIAFIREEGFTRCFMLNPYGNPHRLSLYNALKEEGIRNVAYDRGAYNDSWFFDTKGFLGESGSYDRSLWDRPLSEDEKISTRNWIETHRRSNETLERNGSRLGGQHLRQILKLGDRRVLFVALQRPSDTATIHFSGPSLNAENFNTWVSRLASEIDPRRYIVVVKKHPLESERPDIDNVIFASDDTHINDLIELCDKVVVINSGTGLIAATYGKPVICCGTAFYAHDGFAYRASSVEQLIELAGQKLAVDEETRLRFVHYLVNNFYSFGKSEYDSKVSASTGSTIRVVNRTVFSEIRGLTADSIVLGHPPKGVSLDAPLFYSYGGRTGIQMSASKPQPKSAPQTHKLPTQKPQVQQPPTPKLQAAASLGGKRKINIFRRPLVPVVRPFVRLLGNPHDVIQFNHDPTGFFQNLKNVRYQRIGRMLFP